MTNPTTIKVTGLLMMPSAGTRGRSSDGESCAACLPTGDAPKALRRLLRAVRRACQRCSICHPYERPWWAPSQVCLKACLFLPCIRPLSGVRWIGLGVTSGIRRRRGAERAACSAGAWPAPAASASSDCLPWRCLPWQSNAGSSCARLLHRDVPLFHDPLWSVLVQSFIRLHDHSYQRKLFIRAAISTPWKNYRSQI